MPRWGFIGSGKMATALIRGMIRAGLAPAGSICASDPLPSARETLASDAGIATFASNLEVVGRSDVLVLAVKPQGMRKVLHELRPSVTAEHLVISVAAGTTIASIDEDLGGRGRLVRVMPNTPALVGEGASAYAMGPRTVPDDEAIVTACLESVGRSVRVPESLLDAVTGLSGSGPAFVYVMIEALSDGGVRVGLPREVATMLAVQTVLGAAMTVRETGLHPAVLKDQVASPGGTTIAGLHELERGGVRGALIDAVEAAARRSAELAALTRPSHPPGPGPAPPPPPPASAWAEAQAPRSAAQASARGAAMKLGLISDIHGDPIALELAWSHLIVMGADRIVCAGDLVGYGRFPDRVSAFVRDRGIDAVRGNHDRWALERGPGVRDEFGGGTPSPETLEHLRSLPFDLLVADGRRVGVVVHGSPRSDMEFVNRAHPRAGHPARRPCRAALRPPGRRPHPPAHVVPLPRGAGGQPRVGHLDEGARRDLPHVRPGRPGDARAELPRRRDGRDRCNPALVMLPFPGSSTSETAREVPASPIPGGVHAPPPAAPGASRGPCSAEFHLARQVVMRDGKARRRPRYQSKTRWESR